MDFENKQDSLVNFPSPEELFPEKETAKLTLKPRTDVRHQSVPAYRVIRFFTRSFLVLMLLVCIAVCSLKYVGVQVYAMSSESMGDTIPEGSLVLVKAVRMQDLCIGDNVTYVRDGRSVTHRVVEINPNFEGKGVYALTTKGVANDAADDEPVTQEMLRGKVVYSVPHVAKPYLFLRGKK